ncbi:MAG: peptidylprolyl isomerase, partial [bacterium]|nr:peptidylprolyl isomerase [bacterium]
YHIVKVQEHTPGGPVALEDVKEQLAEHLLEQARTHAVEVYLDSLKAIATIERTEE